ncbi:MAG: PD40 domain-containing protein [Candidatus Thermoplasmatota archaeon]|nr:PD40 domain-containing protein [Candidatus Thermoplasmatota archaeon]
MKAQCLVILFLSSVVFFTGCIQEHENDEMVLSNRASKIPSTAVKMTPSNDTYPPQVHSTEFLMPIPLSGLVNTAGAEDSPFLTSDGSALYFFFTPDVSVPVEKQVLDGVTGIYVSYQQNGSWSEPERVMLQDVGKLALDGCACVDEDILWFCSAREGYTGVQWFSAQYLQGKWRDWQQVDFNPDYEVGELHIHGDALYFHSSRPGGQGQRDIWVSKRIAGEWQTPCNIEAVNSPDDEGYPYITADGKELWFTRIYLGSPGVFRSKKVNESWQSPQLILSQFAGEPTLDPAGNVYFVHHFYKDGVMIEADIYIALKV